MTDLTKGIIEINGTAVNPNATLTRFLEDFDNCYSNRAVSKNKNVEIFTFKKVEILNRIFDIDITFIRQKLSDIALYSCYEASSSYEDRFKADCAWLRGVLGEPSEAGSHGIIYKFDGAHIGVSWWKSDGRNGPDEYISISY